MTFEELQEEATRQGYYLKKRTKYEKFIPCAFCKKNSRSTFRQIDDKGKKLFSLKCNGCDFKVYSDHESTLKAKWNRTMEFYGGNKEVKSND